MSLLRFLTLVLVLIALVACSQGDPFPDDGPAISVSEDAAFHLLEKSAQAASTAADTGASSITITQEEITSVLGLAVSVPDKLNDYQKQLAAQDPSLEQLPNIGDTMVLSLLKEPQVYFKDDGTLVLRGRIEFQGQVQPFRFVSRPSGQSGELKLDFVEGRIGAVNMPQTVFNQIGNLLAKVILLGQRWAEITDLHVDAGSMTIAGRRN